jgi:hypothetical protein
MTEGMDIFLPFPAIRPIPINFFRPFMLCKADRDMLREGIRAGGKTRIIADFLKLLGSALTDVNIFPTRVIEKGKTRSIRRRAKELNEGDPKRFVATICNLNGDQYWVVIDNDESNAYWGVTSPGNQEGTEMLHDFIFRYAFQRKHNIDGLALRKVGSRTSESREVASTFSMAALMEFFLRDEINGDDLRQFREADAEAISQRLLLSVLKGTFIFPVNEVGMGMEELPRPIAVSTMTQLNVRDRSPERRLTIAKKKKKQIAVLDKDGFPRVIVMQNMSPPESFPNDLSLAIILLVAFLTSQEQKRINGVLTPTRLRDYVCRNLSGVSEAAFNIAMTGFRYDLSTWLEIAPGHQPVRVQHDPAFTFRVVLTEYGLYQIEDLCKFEKWTFQQGRKSRTALELKLLTRPMLTAPPVRKKLSDREDDGPSLLKSACRNHIAIIETVLATRIRPLKIIEICYGIDMIECGWSSVAEFSKHGRSDQKIINTAIRQAANRGLKDTKKTKKKFYVKKKVIKSFEEKAPSGFQPIMLAKKPVIERYFGLLEINPAIPGATPPGHYRKQVEENAAGPVSWRVYDRGPPPISSLFVALDDQNKVFRCEDGKVTALVQLHPGTLLETPNPLSRWSLFHAESGPTIVRYESFGKTYGFIQEARLPGQNVTIEYTTFS